MSNPSPKERRLAIWDALWNSINDDPPIDFENDPEWQWPFLLAQYVQGVVVQQGFNPAKATLASLRDFLCEFAEQNDLEADHLIEEFWAAWPKVKVPRGVDPIRAAAERATGETKLDGDWPTESFRRDVTRVYEIAVDLARTGDGVFFLPCRKLAEVLNTDAMRVSRILNALVERGHLRKTGDRKMRQAQRFEVAK